MKLAIITAHAGADSLYDALTSWNPGVVYKYHGDSHEALFSREGLLNGGPPAFIEDGPAGMLPAYQAGFDRAVEADILAYLHDDTIIHDKDWVSRVLAEFKDPQVGLVGFGGALGHGSPALYRDPYDYHQLGRIHFMSNMTDAENHGERFTGSRDVAVLDGFALIVRRSILEKVGWGIDTPCHYIGYDYRLCIETRRLGYRIRLVGCSVSHLGGRTYVKLGIGKDPKFWDEYLAAHRWIYDHYQGTGLLPYEVPR